MPQINSSFSPFNVAFDAPAAALPAIASKTNDYSALTLEFDPTALGYPDPKNRPAELHLTKKQIEMQMLKQLGLDVDSPENLALVKKRLASDDPVATLSKTLAGERIATYNLHTGKY